MQRRFSDLMKEEAKAMKIENDQDRFVWEAAAARWRLPYWDWALDSRLPELVCKKDIDIISGWNAATGTADRVPVHNPMYRFRMPGGKAMGDESYGDYRITPADGLPVRDLYTPSHLIMLIVMNSLTCAKELAAMQLASIPRKRTGSRASPTSSKRIRPWSTPSGLVKRPRH